MSLIKLESIVNQAVKVPFTSVNLVTGMSSFTNVHLVKDGVGLTGITSPILPTITYTEIGNGMYLASFIPTVSGEYSLFIEAQIQGQVTVVAKSLYTFLQNIEDAELGSWEWDKNAGTLTFLRQTGATMAGFDVVDNLTTASRERTTP